MSSSKTNPMMSKAWRATVGELAHHNGAVELVPVTEQGVELPRVRARLLKADGNDGSLIVEKPGNLKQAQALAKDVAVDVYVITDHSRMKARSRVIDLGLFNLNKKTRVMAVRLEPVRDIASAQRRACFRLSTVSLGLSAKLRHEAWPTSQRSMTAKVVDLSDRGIGLTGGLEIELAKQMKGQVYQLVVPLPGQNEDLELDACLVRVVETEFNTVTLGFQFDFESLGQQRRVERMVQQFSVAQQRKQIQRMRGAG